MTRRAKAIERLVEEIQWIAVNGTPLRMAINGNNQQMTVVEAKQKIHQSALNMKASFADLMENNPEQAEALMQELGVKWNNPEK